MKKTILVIIIIILLFCLSITRAQGCYIEETTTNEVTISEVYIPSENIDDSLKDYTREESILALKKKNKSFTFLEISLDLDLREFKVLAQKISEEAEKQAKEKERLDRMYAQYPVATQCWMTMKSYGWSDVVCAGIIGNMMAEVGGHTLNLQWNSYSGSYYGLCQWALIYYTGPSNATISQQMNYLYGDIRQQFNNYGSNYYRGFNFNAFL